MSGSDERGENREAMLSALRQGKICRLAGFLSEDTLLFKNIEKTAARLELVHK
jgi:hypothetical protein